VTCQPWPVTWPREFDPTVIPQPLVAAALDGAGNLFWALTGRVYGICSTVEHYRAACPPGHSVGRPYKDGSGYWHNVGFGGSCRITLQSQPVRSVESVTVQGAVALDWFREGNDIVRQGACWPSVSDVDPAPVSVAYTYGAGFPKGSDLAIGELAMELLNPLVGKECHLPSTVTAVTRNNVTVSRLDIGTLAQLPRLVTGLPITDMIVAALNPKGVAQPAKVWSVDGARRVG
jgi:hypothetical protein